MSNTTFKGTEGNWKVTEGEHSETTDTYDEGERWFNVNNESGEVVCDVLHGRCLDADEDCARANATLIAQSPAMLEFLIDIRDSGDTSMLAGHWSRLNSIIQKALNP